MERTIFQELGTRDAYTVRIHYQQVLRYMSQGRCQSVQYLSLAWCTLPMLTVRPVARCTLCGVQCKHCQQTVRRQVATWHTMTVAVYCYRAGVTHSGPGRGHNTAPVTTATAIQVLGPQYVMNGQESPKAKASMIPPPPKHTHIHTQTVDCIC